MAGTYKLRRNKLACVSSKFISLKHSLTRVFELLCLNKSIAIQLCLSSIDTVYFI